jgi:LPS O-antigen subunit length determinant protein (WzzB/FepE family)
MKKNTHIYHENEIDLINLFNIIWDDKIKILVFTIISFLIGFGYSYQVPNNYLISLVIKKSDNYQFNKFNYIEKVLKKNQKNQKNQTNQTNQTNQRILNRFFSELIDYEELSINLENIKTVRENITKLPIEKKRKKLFQYAKSLEIVEKVKNDKTSYTLNFKWHNTDEAKKILESTINLTLKNLEKAIYEEFEQILEFEKKIHKNKDLIRLEYLSEQSSIARELNILDNQIDNVNLTQSNVSLNINTADIAYYLRGFRAIDKEIELIKNRDYQNFEFIKQEIANLKKKDIKWIDYNIYSLEIKSLKNTKKIIIMSILLGLIVGLIFVLISNAIQSQTVSKKTK